PGLQGGVAEQEHRLVRVTEEVLSKRPAQQHEAAEGDHEKRIPFQPGQHPYVQSARRDGLCRLYEHLPAESTHACSRTCLRGVGLYERGAIYLKLNPGTSRSGADVRTRPPFYC